MARATVILRKVALAAGAIAVTLLLVECGLRLARISYPRTTQSDPVLGVLHRPGISYWYADEGAAQIDINRDGFRDVDWPIEKPAGEFRIAVLGDSYVEAVQVPVEERFTEVLAHRLQDSPEFAGRTVRVMNFGMAGFGTAQELLVLRDRVAQFHPDLVVLAVLTGNDLSDNSRALRPHNRRPFFAISDGQLELDDSFRDNLANDERPSAVMLHTLADYSRIVQLASRAVRTMRTKAEIARIQAQLDESPQEIGLDEAVYCEPQTPEWREAWELMERLLLAIDDTTRSLGAKLLVVTLSNSSQVDPDPKVTKKHTDHLHVPDMFYPDRRIAQFCNQHDIRVLTLAPDFARFALEQNKYLHGFENIGYGSGHWNALGHEMAAERMTEQIKQMVSAPPAQDSPAAAQEP